MEGSHIRVLRDTMGSYGKGKGREGSSPFGEGISLFLSKHCNGLYPLEAKACRWEHDFSAS
jgi:hypothetical protein